MSPTPRNLLLLAFLLALAPCAVASTCAVPAREEIVDVPGHPFAAVSTADSCWLFVSVERGRSRGSIAVLRNQDGHFGLDHQIELAQNVFGESISHDGRLLIVAAGSETAVFDVAALEHGDAKPLLGMLDNGRDAGAIYTEITSDEQLLFVSDENEKKISVFDLGALRSQNSYHGSEIGHVPMGNSPVGMALSPDGHWLFATSEVGPTTSRQATCDPETRGERKHAQGLLLIVDVSKARKDPAHALAGAFPAGCNPVRVASSPDGKHVWVTSRGDGKLARFSMDTWLNGSKTIGSVTFAIGASPVGVAVRPDGRQVWVALSNRFGKTSAGQLAGLADTLEDSPSKLLSAPAPGFPREITFLADGRTIVATLFDADKVEVISTPE